MSADRNHPPPPVPLPTEFERFQNLLDRLLAVPRAVVEQRMWAHDARSAMKDRRRGPKRKVRYVPEAPLTEVHRSVLYEVSMQPGVSVPQLAAALRVTEMQTPGPDGFEVRKAVFGLLTGGKLVASSRFHLAIPDAESELAYEDAPADAFDMNFLLAGL